MIYVFEHATLRGGSMAFGAWDGHSIDLTLEGVADVWADERYDCDLPIRIHVPLSFVGIVVDEGSAERARDRLARHFDAAQFSEPAARPEGGFLFASRDVA